MFRRACQLDDIEVVAINDLIDVDYIAYMLRYDSTHGRFGGSVAVDNGQLVVNGKAIRITAERDPANLAWDAVGAEYVLESTGFFLTDEAARAHLRAGAKRVVMSAPSKDDTPMFVMGVNHTTYAGQEIVSKRLLHHQLPGAPGEGGARQLRHRRGPDDHRACHHRHPENRGRPLGEGLARRPRRGAEHHPLLHRRGQGRGPGDPGPERQAHRHGFPGAHPERVVVDLTVNLERAASYDAIKAAVKAASEGELAGILGYTEDEVVSTDFLGQSCTSIFDAKAGIALTDTFVKLVSWYDNEWGYSCKCLELMRHMATVA